MKAPEYYPRIPACPEQSGWGFARDDWFDDRAAERKLIQQKRLTDAELAAEVHAANSAAWRAHSTKGGGLPLLEDRFETLYRFAALPHYDEAAS